MIERIDTPDSATVVMHWKVASQNGNDLGYRELDVLPRHVIGESFEADPAGFANSPYLVDPSVFVGSGPFKPTEWERGSQLTAVAFDRYFQGRPKIDRVVFKVVTDAQTMLANVMAGSVDLTLNALSIDGAYAIQREWAQTDGGAVLMQPNNMRLIIPQLKAEFTTPRDLLDLEVRRALFHTLDRAAVAEANGLTADFVADSAATRGTPLAAVVDPAVMKYAYDPTRAVALLQGAGWQRGADGRLMKDGRPFDLDFTEGTKTQVFPIAQQSFAQVGIGLSYTPAVAADLRAFVEYTGIQSASSGINPIANWTTRYESQQISSAANRYSGGNLGGYSSPATDRAIANLKGALRPQDQYQAFAQAWRQITEDVAVIPTYFEPIAYTGRKGVMGWQPQSPIGEWTYAPHLWDIS
jgi:peptide/nickel transport system substrate-binding protein